jgi:hypothetical protein
MIIKYDVIELRRDWDDGVIAVFVLPRLFALSRLFASMLFDLRKPPPAVSLGKIPAATARCRPILQPQN